MNNLFWSGKRVFITGHTGFKGSWLTLWLNSMGAVVRGFALPPNTTPNAFEALNTESLCQHQLGDIRDVGALQKSLQEFDPDVAMHLAAQPLVRESYRQPAETFSVNVQGTVNFLEACRLAGTRSIVVVTTDKVYENREWPFSYREADPLGGFDPYSASKACAEIVTASYRQAYFPADSYENHHIALASARAGNVFGGGDWNEDRLIPDAVRSFTKKETLFIRNPESVRPWQHVLEPLSGYLKLAQLLFEEGAAYARAWNFGPDNSRLFTVGEIADTFIRAWGEGATWRHKNEPDGFHETQLLMLDSGLANRMLGWLPCLTLSQSVIATVEWYKAFYAGARGKSLRELTLRQIDEFAANQADSIAS